MTPGAIVGYITDDIKQRLDGLLGEHGIPIRDEYLWSDVQGEFMSEFENFIARGFVWLFKAVTD